MTLTTLELHSIDNIWYIYCPKSSKYFRYKYTVHAAANVAMCNILNAWPEEYEQDMQLSFVQTIDETISCIGY